MKKAKSTEKHIREVYANKLQVTTNSNLDKRVLANSMNVLEKLKNIRSANPQPGIWSTIARSKIAQISVATAVIILAVSFLIVLLNPNKQGETVEVSQAVKSPAELTTFASLTFAYRRGGMEAVEQICDKALAMAGPPLSGISVQNLLEEFDGKIQKGQSYGK